MEFAESGRLFGLEMQAPWADLVLQGKKEIETRSYPLPPSLLYKHVAIIESESSSCNVSGLSDCVTLIEGGSPRIVGTVVFSECFEYKSGRQWDADYERHLVEKGSSFGWPQRKKPKKNKKVKIKDNKSSSLRGKDEKDTKEVEVALTIKGEESSNHLISGSSWLTKGDSRFKSSGRFGRPKTPQKVATVVPVNKTSSRTDRSDGLTLSEGRQSEEQRQEKEQDEEEEKEEEEEEEEEVEGSEEEEEEEAVPRKRFFGWRVLGAFRSSIPPSQVPTILRLHRSLFDCGPLSSVPSIS